MVHGVQSAREDFAIAEGLAEPKNKEDISKEKIKVRSCRAREV